MLSACLGIRENLISSLFLSLLSPQLSPPLSPPLSPQVSPPARPVCTASQTAFTCYPLVWVSRELVMVSPKCFNVSLLRFHGFTVTAAIGWCHVSRVKCHMPCKCQFSYFKYSSIYFTTLYHKLCSFVLNNRILTFNWLGKWKYLVCKNMRINF